MRMSRLVRKTLLGLMVLFGAAVIAATLVSGWTLNRHLSEQYESKGNAIASSIASSSVDILLNRDASTLQSIIDQFTEIQGVSYVFIVDDLGDIVAHTFVPSIPKEVGTVPAARSGLVHRELQIPGMGEFTDISAPILAGVAGYVHVGMNRGLIAAETRSAMLTAFLGIFAVMLPLMSGLAFWLTRKVAAPVISLTESARSIERGEKFNPEHLVTAVRAGDEIADLARVFADMATALEQRAEEERLAAEARYRSLFDGVPVGLYQTTVDGHFMNANPALVELSGYPDAESLMAASASSLYVSAEDRVRWHDRVEHEGTVRGFELQFRRGDGSVIWVRTSARAVRDTGGALQYYEGAIQDVTREREVDRMKSEFVSLVSHELRTPLTSIKGYVDLLLEGEVGDVPEEQKEFLGIVKSNADRLVALINDLLDLSRIEAGRIELKRAPLDLARLVQGAATSLRPQIDAKGQKLVLQLDSDLPPTSGDSDRITQVLTNLLSNAYKYTPAGGTITVSLRCEVNKLKVDVRDTGIGLSPEDLEKLFTKFFRAKNRVTQEVGGTGLGLPITKSLVEMHGGEMTVTSVAGEGSTFGFTLPIVDEPQEEPELEIALQAAVRAGGKVLVVDDEPDIANLLRRYLEHGGHEVVVAGNGAEAFRMARAERPDLITLDVKLPDVDGFTVLEWLKNEPETSSIPVVMVSMMPDEGHGKLLGAIDYLPKPTNEAVFLDRVGRVLDNSRLQAVLVADDDPDIRRLLAGYLHRAGYRVLEAGDGAEALEVVRRDHPGLVLMDVRMPGLDGIAAVRELRSVAETKGIPVVMMTASPGALEEGQSVIETLGISALLSKPFTAEELAQAIARGLSK